MDLSCPGVGHGIREPDELTVLLGDDGALDETQSEAVHHLTTLLTGRQLFAPSSVLKDCGVAFLRELEAVWPGTLRVGQVMGPMVNVEGGLPLEEAWRRLGLPLVESPAPQEAPGFMARHFGEWHWNTRFIEGDRVVRYRFVWSEGRWEVEGVHGGRYGLPAAISWSAEALQVRRAYLERWLERQLAVRFAHHLAATSPWPMHVARVFVDFVGEVDQRIRILATSVAGWMEAERVELAHVLEAVRGSDALLRSWCQGTQTVLPGAAMG